MKIKSKILLKIQEEFNIQITDYIHDTRKSVLEVDGFKILKDELSKEKFLEILDFASKNTKIEIFNKNLTAVYDDTLFSDTLEIVKAKYAGTYKKCKNCGKYFIGNGEYCSSKCSNSSKEVQAKKKESYIQRYGVDNAGKTQNSIEKAKFYSKNILNSKENIEIRREKWKNEEYKNKVMSSVRKTLLEKYGVASGFETDNCKNGLKKFLKENGVENTAHIPEVRQKISLNNANKRHLFHQDEYNEEGFRKFIENGKFKIKECMEYFNIVGRSTVNHHKKQFNILEDNDDWIDGYSNAEKKLCEFVKSLGVNVIENTRFLGKEIDIFIPSARLGIEYDGTYWHSSWFKPETYHLEKTQLCESNNIHLFHIFDTDNQNIWKNIIKSKLNLNKKIYARKCEVVDISFAECRDFLDENHLQGSCMSSVRLGLVYDNELVEVMTFGKPRFNRKYDYELLRLCTKGGLTVVGGASKLLKYFEKKYKGSIVSYCDLRYSSGEIYNTLGFSNVGQSEPNYFYCKDGEILTRYQCQKHKLKDILENFDPDLTEKENMDKHGYYCVYDCGNLIFAKA